GTATATGVAGLAAGAAGGAFGQAAASEPGEPALSTLGSTTVPFHGVHQPGITTPLQSRSHLVAFDLVDDAGRRGAAALLRRWSTLAAALMAGRPDEAGTGIADDAGPASLTFTFGFGHGFFDATGLTALRPEALRPLPAFSQDALDEARSNGDLWVQIGADDPLVAFEALRAVRRAAEGTARVRWRMAGFHRSPGATARPMTGRNLMGQVDGTNNPSPDDPDFERHVFVPADGEPAWMAGGSYAVVRRIRMLLDDWEGLTGEERERVLGRRRSDGAPLTGGSETSPVDLAATNPDGSPVIPANAHVRVTAPESNGGATMLRRSFSYDDGFREDGAPDAGLLFVCWQADPLRSFVTVQRKLDRGDALSAFVRHEASGLFAVPGGAAEDEYVGQRLLEG
ncbi:iron uptake transporter deferrochelatase/peroxidase subunit, partial [Streptomyces triticirhizae]